MLYYYILYVVYYILYNVYNIYNNIIYIYLILHKNICHKLYYYLETKCL